MAIFIIARLTFLEAVRRRILLAAFLLGVAFLLLFAAMPMLMTAFSRIIDGGFSSIGALVVGLGGVR